MKALSLELSNSFIFKMKKKITFFEIIFWLIFLVFLFASPILLSGFDDNFNWQNVFHSWRNFVVVIVILLLHHFVLVKKFFSEKKWLPYLFSVTVLIFGMVIFSVIFFKDSPPPKILNNFPPKPIKPLPPFVSILILSVLGISLDAGFRLFQNFTKAEQQKMLLEKEKAENQLVFLRNQISPHFFMNTLNNIHSLVEIDAEKAQNAIVKLSTLMRYLLYEVQNEKVDLQKELDFVKSYFSLMQLRVWDNVDIKVEIPEQIPLVKIPPTMFVSFIENAFKHGISATQKSFIHFKINVENQFLMAEINNSKHQKTTELNDEYSGIGLENIKKTLNLLYPNTHQLNIFDDEHNFKVNLKIPI